MSLMTPLTHTSRLMIVVNARRKAYGPVATHPGLDAAAGLITRRLPLPEHLRDGPDERADRVRGPGEVLAVALPGSTLLLRAGNAHREHGPLGVTGEEVAVARPVVGQEPVAVAVAALDLGRRFRVVRDHHVAGVLLHPAKRRHVGGGTVEDAALADAGLGRPLRAPADDAMAPVVEPAMQRRHVARRQRHPQHRLGQPVDLHEHDAGNIGGRGPSPLTDEASDPLVVPGVVVEGECRCQQRGDDGGDDRHEQRRPEPVETDAGELAQHHPGEEGVDHQVGHAHRVHRQWHQHEGERRPDESVEEPDNQAGQQGVADALDLEVRQQPRRDEQRSCDDQGDRRGSSR